MVARTHDLIAFNALLAVVLLMPVGTVTLATVLTAFLANQLGGIVPDIDQPTAPFWRNLPIGGVVGKVFDKLLGGHRFVTHSLLGVGLFAALGYMLLNFLHPVTPAINDWYVWCAFVIGMLSHLVADTVTKEGVPWLLPLPIRFGFPPIKSLRITAGHTVETFIIFPGLVILDIVFCVTHYHMLLMLLHHSIVY